MKYILICICLLFHSEAEAFRFIDMNPVRQINAGIDISQLGYYLGSGNQGLNLGAFAQYKPYRFLDLNTSVYANNVNYQGGRINYSSLYNYRSKGICFKAGVNLSLGISRKYPDRRFFFGWQSCLLSFIESGEFAYRDLYWGPFSREFELNRGSRLVGETIGGFQLPLRKMLLRVQFYGLFLKDDKMLTYPENHPIPGYATPFIPGFGFRRGGVNLLILYRFGE